MTGPSGFDRIRAFDAVVIGSGVAGLTAAIELSPLRVALVTKGKLGAGGSTAWAQGGIAAAVGPGDTPRLHAEDTLAAGAGLNDPESVAILTKEGPERVIRLMGLGASFDHAPDGGLALGREAAHGRRRILHAHGDATGAEVARALRRAAEATKSIEVCTDTFAWDLMVEAGRVVGVTAVTATGERVLFRAPAVVLATGGIGRLYRATTNPPEVTGDGLAMAARAGARVSDVEFVQFHPTALAAPGADPMPLLTEALRGEGAVLLDATGHRFMLDEHPDAELAPRDIVARAIFRRVAAGERVTLDARAAVGERFPERFPTVFELCQRHGLDPRVEPIPVSPAEHYHMGGVTTDVHGRTTLPGLWACGEAASNGVHGANRLASNSLLDGLVFGARVAHGIRHDSPPPIRVAAWPEPPPRDASRLPTSPAGAAKLLELRTAASLGAGVVRDAAGLETMLDQLASFEPHVTEMGGEGRNLLLVGRLVASAALARPESRGGHYRRDFPEPDPAWRRHLELALGADGTVEVISRELLPGEPETAHEERRA
ncbi:MAG: L-aspartate oxidase [Thermoanaerobaculia bacterium]|nr:L-aspartate oxidase [Thermoanaerobaculia bacterium]